MSLAISREIEDLVGISGRSLFLGHYRMLKGDYSQAEVVMRRAIPSNLWKETRLGWRVITPHLLGWIALCRKQGKYPTSARLIGTVDSIYQQIAPGLAPRERSEYEEDRAFTRSALGEDAFAAAFAAGKAMTFEQAITWVAREMNVSRE